MNEETELSCPPLPGDESSSDDERAVVGWRHIPERHSLFCADHLQLELWREMLREEIEEVGSCYCRYMEEVGSCYCRYMEEVGSCYCRYME